MSLEFSKVWANCSCVLLNRTSSGKCSVCQQSLAPVTVTADELKRLKSRFFARVVKGRNIFENTTESEWREFEACIRANGPFDLVVDGLNVAFGANNPKYLSTPTGPSVIKVSNTMTPAMNWEFDAKRDIFNKFCSSPD